MATPLTSKEFGRRFRKAVSIPLHIDQACSAAIQQFVKSYATAVGCNEKCIFFPLLTCCAACMGPNASVQITPDWTEPAIIWTMVITPTTLCRIDVAEHLKQQLLAVQNEFYITKTEDEAPPPCNKFVVDVINLDCLQDTLKVNDGQAVAIYNNTRMLHGMMSTAQDVEVMLKLHSGSSWFSSSKMTKKLLNRTHVNLSIISTPSAVHNTLVTMNDFQELFTNCFLTICSEENHIKFSQLSSSSSEAENLQKIFKEVIKLHFENPIVYRFNEEASEKFSQIHDEITDKAKQLARKNPEKVFKPVLSYLGRISCILHVLDNILDGINFTVPVDRMTWNVEINADTVWRARQVLGYVIEQKHALSQPTTVETTPAPPQSPIDAVTVDDNRAPRVTQYRGTPYSPRSQYSPVSGRGNVNIPGRGNPVNTPNQNYFPSGGRPVGGLFRNMPRRRSMATPLARQGPPPPGDNAAFDLLLTNNSSSNNTSQVNGMGQGENRAEPMIVSVRSAGVPVPMDTAVSQTAAKEGTTYPQTVALPVPSDTVAAPTRKVQATPVTPQSLALLNNDDFFKSFKVHIRRLLKHDLKEISIALCVQMKFAPKHSGANPTVEQNNAMARIFLKRLETLGFGITDGTNGLNSRSFVFKKRPYSTLGDTQRKFLMELRVSESEYDKCFVKDPSQKQQQQQQNGSSVVCLE